ncbi:MAG: SEC-C domain-containing protein [Rhizobiaceae bacterium]
MGKGRDRNKPCPCGSGKKYKHCHLNRKDAEPIKLWEAGAELRKSFGKKLCSSPKAWHADCSGQIVKAHTVSKSSSLKKISKDGHVYAFIPSMENLERNNGKLEPVLTGINRASTFTGFCSAHDDKLFAPIEKEDFAIEIEKCFLLGYRAISRELFTKSASANMREFRGLLGRGRSKKIQKAVQNFNSAFSDATDIGVRDIRDIKEQHDKALISGNFDDVRAYVIEFENAPPVMCSAAWMPTYDYDGNKLQDLTNLKNKAHCLTCSSFHSGSKGYVVFQWMASGDEPCKQFISSLHALDDNDLTSGLIRLMFNQFENLLIAPDWWDGQSEENRKKLINRMAETANPFRPIKPDDLAVKDIEFEDWIPVGKTNLGFEL